MSASKTNGSTTPAWRIDNPPPTIDKNGQRHFSQMAWINKRPATSITARRLSQSMPWHVHRGMTEEDLGAAFAYLKTLKPVRHHVDNTEVPTFCKVCRQTHGGGSQN
jgi:hypothetical protein